eukprot:GILI01018175.1.p1 GENE.GILI01018175.1~~GILI01018175.1.p1  ORF type:complete len:717 (+),score=181.99 GILI01018175.1:2-2152(+)
MNLKGQVVTNNNTGANLNSTTNSSASSASTSPSAFSASTSPCVFTSSSQLNMSFAAVSSLSCSHPLPFSTATSSCSSSSSVQSAMSPHISPSPSPCDLSPATSVRSSFSGCVSLDASTVLPSLNTSVSYSDCSYAPTLSPSLSPNLCTAVSNFSFVSSPFSSSSATISSSSSACPSSIPSASSTPASITPAMSPSSLSSSNFSTSVRAISPSALTASLLPSSSPPSSSVPETFADVCKAQSLPQLRFVGSSAPSANPLDATCSSPPSPAISSVSSAPSPYCSSEVLSVASTACPVLSLSSPASFPDLTALGTPQSCSLSAASPAPSSFSTSSTSPSPAHKTYDFIVCDDHVSPSLPPLTLGAAETVESPPNCPPLVDVISDYFNGSSSAPQEQRLSVPVSPALTPTTFSKSVFSETGSISTKGPSLGTGAADTLASAVGDANDELEMDPSISSRLFLRPRATELSKDQQLQAQDQKCAGCQNKLPRGFFSASPRFCEYSGLYFCTSCHSNDLRFIPAKILFGWDFKPRKVCIAARVFLDEVYDKPLIKLSSVSPHLFKDVPSLVHIRAIREQLMRLREYVKSCPDQNGFSQHLETVPDHHFDASDTFSISDLIDVGVTDCLRARLGALLQSLYSHILTSCTSCSSLGKECGICSDPSPLHPFQSSLVTKCFICKSIFHKDCFASVKDCPLCERVTQRPRRCSSPRISARPKLSTFS